MQEVLHAWMNYCASQQPVEFNPICETGALKLYIFQNIELTVSKVQNLKMKEKLMVF